MTTPSSRDLILGRVRRALQAPRDWPAPARPASLAPPAAADTEALLAEFATELTALGGRFIRQPLAEAAEAVAGVLREFDCQAYLAWDAEHLPDPTLLAALAQAGFQRVPAHLPTELAPRQQQLQALAEVPVGITGALAAIAQVGGLVVAGGAGRPRTASLLPPVHLALITPGQVFPTLEAWLSTQAGAGQQDPRAAFGSSLTVIAGPSRTADIEQKLALGVHGPREVIVLCLGE